MTSTLSQSILDRTEGLVRLARRFEWTGVIGLYLIGIFLFHPFFLPNLEDINPWDEAGYLASGPALLAGDLPNIAGNPVLRGFYALTYLPFRNSPFWMVHSASLSKFLLFSLLWLSACLVAKRLSRFTRPVIVAGMLLVTPLAASMLRFPSDPLFAGLAGLSLWQLLSFMETEESRHLFGASAFLGLAALGRNDGLVLFPVFLLLVLFIHLRRRLRLSGIWPAVLPFLALVGGYAVFYGTLTGDFSLGTMRRTYDNFEAGHQTIYGGTGQQNPVIEAKLEARRVFGTPEENDHSVFRAIPRDFPVYLERLKVVILILPRLLLDAYGLRFAALFATLAGVGVFELLRRREFELLIVFTLWPAHLVTGFVITLFRVGHLQFPFYIVFVLAAIGLYALLRRLDQLRWQGPWVAILLALTLYGYLENKLAIAYGASVFLVGYGAAALWWMKSEKASQARNAMLLILLASSMVIHGNFPSPKIRSLGESAKEQAVLIMRENLAPDTGVAAGSPGIVRAAGMRYAGLASTDVPLHRTDAAFREWMISNDIRAIYVDHTLYNDNPAVWQKIKPYIGSLYERIYAGDQGDIQVLLIKSS